MKSSANTMEGEMKQMTERSMKKPIPNRKEMAKRYFILWSTDTIVVNGQPSTVLFPAEK